MWLVRPKRSLTEEQLRGLCAPREGGPCGSCQRCADASPALRKWKPWFSPGNSNLRVRETFVNTVCFNILFLLCPVPTGRINYFEHKQIFCLRCIAGRAACTKRGQARNTQEAIECGLGEVKGPKFGTAGKGGVLSIELSASLSQETAGWKPGLLGSLLQWGSQVKALLPSSPGSNTAFHSLVLKLGCWKLPFLSRGMCFKDNRAVYFNSSQWCFTD